jgi:hypothetical protein
MSFTTVHIKPTETTPEVKFDPTTGKFEIRGRSINENASEFYNPLIDWVKRYTVNAAGSTIVDVSFDYLNTSSSKSLLHLFNVLSTISGKEVNINWLHKKDDEAMKEAGEDFNTIVNLPFNIVETDSI